MQPQQQLRPQGHLQEAVLPATVRRCLLRPVVQAMQEEADVEDPPVTARSQEAEAQEQVAAANLAQTNRND